MSKAYAYGKAGLGVARDVYGLYRGVHSGDWSDLYRYMPSDMSNYFRDRSRYELLDAWKKDHPEYDVDPSALYDEEL